MGGMIRALMRECALQIYCNALLEKEKLLKASIGSAAVSHHRTMTCRE